MMACVTTIEHVSVHHLVTPDAFVLHQNYPNLDFFCYFQNTLHRFCRESCVNALLEDKFVNKYFCPRQHFLLIGLPKQHTQL